ncbi:MAG TPA: hypothetical protein VML50_05785 [Anaeromyxobacter sp.]|nr:hypothetical protein [Anaeromyxobacter sp.]
MKRIIFAALAAIAFFTAQPVFACDDCKNCPMHKVAESDKDKKEAATPPCKCHGAEAKECKCGEKCGCPAHKKAEEKKT